MSFWLFIAYGVSPNLNVGFEEALFLANKIKHDLGGSLSTEKVLYLLFMTLERKHSTKNVRGKKARKASEMCEESESEQYESDTNTFKAFIIRYLYFLREQSIVSQVQKMKSMEEVRSAFRSKGSERNLL